MRLDMAPFSDNNVRLAIKHAVDRESMVELLLRGHGVAGNDHPISPVNRFYASDLPPRAYDPDLARFHLKKAGFETLSVPLHASDTVLGIGVDMAVLFKEHAAKAGIEIEIVRHPADGYWDNVWLQQPWFEGFWAGRPTADWMFTQAYAKDAPWNESGWQNDRFNELLVLARAELDEGKRADMYYEMQMLCRDDGGSVVPLFTNLIDAATDGIRHGKVASNLFGDGFRCSERWWFA
jgi:peptide/nickel transport system substrate-binding protein